MLLLWKRKSQKSCLDIVFQKLRNIQRIKEGLLFVCCLLFPSFPFSSPSFPCLSFLSLLSPFFFLSSLPSFHPSFFPFVDRYRNRSYRHQSISNGVKIKMQISASCSLTLWTFTQFTILPVGENQFFTRSHLNFECVVHTGDRHDTDRESSGLWSHHCNLQPRKAATWPIGSIASIFQSHQHCCLSCCYSTNTVILSGNILLPGNRGPSLKSLIFIQCALLSFITWILSFDPN